MSFFYGTAFADGKFSYSYRILTAGKRDRESRFTHDYYRILRQWPTECVKYHEVYMV